MTDRTTLLSVLARLDQHVAEIEARQANLGDTSNLPLIEDLFELLVDMRVEIEAKLEAMAS